MNKKKDSPCDGQPFEIGVRINNGKPEQFCNGVVDAATSEQVAAQLVALAHAIREEARAAFGV